MPRVYELARQLEVPNATVLQALSVLMKSPPSSASGAVPEDLLDQIAELTHAAVLQHQEGARLIRRAFELARLSGKAEPQEMSSAVLKNRILDLTGRAFEEAEFGVSSFRAWLGLFKDVIAVDDSRRPPWVRLLDPGESATDSEDDRSPARADLALPERWRIRSDLWRAVTDIDAVGHWFWDGEFAQSATAVGHAEARELKPLPTVSSDELRAWRAAFASSTPSPASKVSLERWVAAMLPDAALPYHVRGQWIAALKRNVLVRLRDWFATRELTPPVDLVEETTSRTREEPVEQLRSLVIRCVQEMTRSELEALALPPAVVLRSTGR